MDEEVFTIELSNDHTYVAESEMAVGEIEEAMQDFLTPSVKAHEVTDGASKVIAQAEERQKPLIKVQRVSSLLRSSLNEENVNAKRPDEGKNLKKTEKTPSQLASVIKTHTGKQFHVCTVCNMAFAHKHALKQHEVKVHKVETYYKTCHLCGKQCADIPLHMDSHNTGNAHECTHCDKRFNTNRLLNSHSKKHMRNKELECSECDKVFHDKRTLKRHNMRHQDILPCECNICGQRYTDKKTLSGHKIGMHTEKTHPCNFCGKLFTTENKLNTHLKRHDKNGAFRYNFCNKLMRDKMALERHLVTHTGEKPHKCHICGQGFPYRYYLTHHLLSHTDQKGYPCGICSKVFKWKHGLKKHFKRHTGWKPFTCTVCSKGFTVKKYFLKHIEQNGHKQENVGPGSTKNLPIYVTDKHNENFNEKNPQVEHSAQSLIPLEQEPKEQNLLSPLEIDTRNDEQDNLDDLIDDAEPSKQVAKLSTNLQGQDDDKQVEPPHNILIIKSNSGVHQLILPSNVVLVRQQGANQPAILQTQQSLHQPVLTQNVQSPNQLGTPESGLRLNELPTQQAPSRSVLELQISSGEQLPAQPLNKTAEKFDLQSPVSKDQTQQLMVQEKRITTYKDFKVANKVPFQCNVCKKVFGFKRNLQRHLLIHAGLKPFPCAYCDEAFRQKKQLVNHLYKHTGEKYPHQCTICDSTFREKSALNRHVGLTHERKKQYMCTVCNKVLWYKVTLQKHMDIVHGTLRPFKCPHCEKTFKYRENLTRYEEAHGTEKLHQCTMCNRAFAVKQNLQRHFRQHGGKGKLKKNCQCVLCGKCYACNRDLKKHMGLHDKETQARG